MENSTDHRVGSPFAQEPTVPLEDNPSPVSALQEGATAEPSLWAAGSERLPALQPEPLGDGVWGQTAAAAAYSAVMLLAFAAAGWAIFPAGGVAVAALGAVVSLLGLSSKRNRLATATLVLHGLLFFACYVRAI